MVDETTKTVTLTAEQLAATVQGAVEAALKRAGPRAAPVPGAVHMERCEVCGHGYAPTEDGTCPNNNCPRHTDASIVGVHPALGHAIRDVEEYKTAKAAHAAAV